MNTETNRKYDILVSAKPDGKLAKVATAYQTASGKGYRFRPKADIAQGSMVVIMPSRSFVIKASDGDAEFTSVADAAAKVVPDDSE